MGKKKLEKLNVNSIKEASKKGVKWLISSGIQNSNKDKNFHGAFNAWLNIKNNKYSYLYSEISGYLITFMVFQYQITKKNIYLKSAERSASWLIERAQDKDGGFKCLFLIDKKLKYQKKESLVYSFDNGVIITGLINLYKITKNKKYLNAAIKAADFMIKIFFKKFFSVRPVFNLKTKKFTEDNRQWSLVSGSYHTKISMGLLSLYEVTKNEKYLRYGKKILDGYLKKQKKDGEFLSTRFNINFHPLCYTAEGYWSCGKFLKNKKYLQASKKITKWILEQILSNGTVPRLKLNKVFIYHERVDILSQVLRLLVIHSKELNINQNSKEKIKNLTNTILKYQYLKGSKKKKGGFLWGKKSNGEKTSDINTWVTAFASQAFDILTDSKSKNILKKNPFYLV